LEVDAGDQVREIPLQLGIGVGATEKCRGQWRCPSVYIRYGCDQEVHRFLVLSDGQESSADVEIEDVLLAGDAECGVLDRGDEEGSLGPLSLDGFGGYTGCRSDFRQRGTCVPRIGEQLRRGIEDPQPRRLRLLLTQLGSIRPRRLCCY